MPNLDDRATLAAALRNARQYTLALYSHLSEAERRFPYRATVNPPDWELAHLAWFHEYWCLRSAGRSEPGPSRFPNADPLLNSAIIPHAERWNRPELPWQRVLDYLASVQADQLERLKQAADKDLYFYQLALLHEDMHGEALLMSLQSLGLPAPVPYRAPAPPPPRAPLASDVVEFTAGEFEMGSQTGAGFVFDNEQQPHAVCVAPFALATRTVTTSEFAAFVEAGGYHRRELWSNDGWAWRTQARAEAPVYWRREGNRWLMRRFGGWEDLDEKPAMVHVNAFEAEAYCAFAGGRLPTEAEWEFAARHGRSTAGRFSWGDAPLAPGEVNLDGAYRAPTAPDALPGGDTPAGIRQMLGNVWEWTATPFAPYPGFAPGPYKEYSAPWFHTHRVLRGGSFATRARLVHGRWRNFYTPERRDAFAGFRMAQVF
jgi:iron(II)-dependent oxidoreductase